MSSLRAEGPATLGGGAGQWWSQHPNPKLGEGESSILTPQSPGLRVWTGGRQSFPGWVEAGWGGFLPGPSGVLDVPHIPQGPLIHDAAHLLQSLCLADPL